MSPKEIAWAGGTFNAKGLVRPDGKRRPHDGRGIANAYVMVEMFWDTRKRDALRRFARIVDVGKVRSRYFESQDVMLLRWACAAVKDTSHVKQLLWPYPDAYTRSRWEWAEEVVRQRRTPNGARGKRAP